MDSITIVGFIACTAVSAGSDTAIMERRIAMEERTVVKMWMMIRQTGTVTGDSASYISTQ